MLVKLRSLGECETTNLTPKITWFMVSDFSKMTILVQIYSRSGHRLLSSFWGPKWISHMGLFANLFSNRIFVRTSWHRSPTSRIDFSIRKGAIPPKLNCIWNARFLAQLPRIFPAPSWFILKRCFTYPILPTLTRALHQDDVSYASKTPSNY